MESGSLSFCMVTTFYPPYHFGGDAMYVYRLTEALAARGHKVDVVHSVDAYHLQHPAAPEEAFTHHANVRLHALSTKRPLWASLTAHQLGRPGFYAGRLREALEARRYDVIHFHNVSLMGAPGVLAMGRGVKFYTANEYWLICPTHVLFAFDREACTERRCLACTVWHYRRPPQLWRYTGDLERALEHVDCLLLPSRFALEQHRAQGVKRPMLHLPPPIPTMASEQMLDEEKPVSGRPFFLYVGRLEKLKGVQDLLRLFREYDAADLVIVGGGSYGDTLREMGRGLPHVKFAGRLHPSELARLYRRAVAVLVPSLCYETFGLTAAEAMAFGTPAIVRRIGALQENVEQSGGGLCFSSLDECRAAMEALRSDPALRRRLGENGRRAVEELWSVDVHMRAYFRVVESAMRGEGIPREPSPITTATGQ